GHSGNLISGNWINGILIHQSDDNGVAGNLIGTDASGTAQLYNGDGVVIQAARQNTIGGTAGGAGHVIAGNNVFGIHRGDGAHATVDNHVEGTSNGTDAAGTAALPNDDDGVHIGNGAGRNTIGGTAAGAGNVIAHNRKSGVVVVNDSLG